jgi:hypothetical protein
VSCLLIKCSKYFVFCSLTSAVFTTVLIMSSMIPLTILSLDTDETVRNLSIEFSVVLYLELWDISAFTGRNDFIFDIWLLHGDLYHVSPFQVYRTSTSCLPHIYFLFTAWLRIFHVCRNENFCNRYIKTFVTDILASTGRNDFIYVR